jgi:hypothetical protein
MSLLSKSAAATAMAGYQRQLFRVILPALGVYLAIVIPLILFYVAFADQLSQSYKTPVGIALMVVVVVAMQIPLASFRRNARELSVANGLVCPNCQSPLCDSYATLKRTGKCRYCGSQVIDAV